jgi:hypothetical protein
MPPKGWKQSPEALERMKESQRLTRAEQEAALAEPDPTIRAELLAKAEEARKERTRERDRMRSRGLTQAKPRGSKPAKPGKTKKERDREALLAAIALGERAEARGATGRPDEAAPIGSVLKNDQQRRREAIDQETRARGLRAEAAKAPHAWLFWTEEGEPGALWLNGPYGRIVRFAPRPYAEFCRVDGEEVLDMLVECEGRILGEEVPDNGDAIEIVAA